MKVIVTGAHGQLGNAIVKKLAHKYNVYAFTSKELDIGNEEKVFTVLKNIKPHYVINCAAYNKVDLAEVDRQQAKYVNEIGTYYLAKGAQLIKATLVHISTDYVFDGNKKTPYTEDDIPYPINYYGLTKYNGEEFIKEICSKFIIVRTAWLYSKQPNNFLHTIQRLAAEHDTLKIVNDQIGTPTYVEGLAETIKRLMENECYGIYHCSGNGTCSWYDFAKEIVRLSGITCDIQPISTREYGQKARRPLYSVLDNKGLRNTIGDIMKPWQEALENYFDVDKEYK